MSHGDRLNLFQKTWGSDSGNYHVPVGFAVGAEPVRRPGEAPREGVSSKNGWGWGGVMREIGVLVQGDWWYKEECMSVQNPNCHFGFENLVGGKKTSC